MSEREHELHDVFISYSSADQAWVRGDLLPSLEAAGLRVLIDYRDFEIGTAKLVNTERAVDACRHTLIVLTPSWTDSEAAEFESLLAETVDPAGRRRKLIPLLFAPCELPRRLAALTPADFTDPDTRDEQMERLLRGLGADPARARIEAHRARVFISYKRGVEPDEPLALQIRAALGQQHDVFIDQAMPIGARWAERIEDEIGAADFLITLLSASSVHSEMVGTEIEIAHRKAQCQHGRPAILPVRLDYNEPFKYPLSAYLDHINWAFWRGEDDTARLVGELLRAVSGADLVGGAPAPAAAPDAPASIPRPLPAAQPAALDLPEGTMEIESAFYVERASDPVALETIRRQGVTITIKGPRQMGKSSLLIRVVGAAAAAGRRVAFLDFQLFDKAALTDANRFYRQFCSWLTDMLELPDQVEKYWDVPLGNSQLCTRYVSRYLLPELKAPLLLAMDEVEAIFDTEFRSDFFGMLRGWHNGRATTPIWKQLDLALVTSTEPYQLIENLNQSPFNVGQVIDMADFTPEQVADLNRRHGAPLGADEERWLVELIGGHPYLVRRALYLVASRQTSAAAMFEHATDDRGPFGDHLRNHLFRLHGKQNLAQAMRQVIDKRPGLDEAIFWKLRGAGLVRRDLGGEVAPRCALYADYFKERLHD